MELFVYYMFVVYARCEHNAIMGGEKIKRDPTTAIVRIVPFSPLDVRMYCCGRVPAARS